MSTRRLIRRWKLIAALLCLPWVIAPLTGCVNHPANAQSPGSRDIPSGSSHSDAPRTLDSSASVPPASHTVAVGGPGTIHWQTYQEARSEYQAQEKQLTLGSGWSWPRETEPASGPDGRPQFFEPGSATNDAQSYWWCSWAVQLLHDPNAPSAGSTQSRLSSVRGMYLYKVGLQGSDQRWFEGILSAAEHKHFDLLDDYVTKNCAHGT